MNTNPYNSDTGASAANKRWNPPTPTTTDVLSATNDMMPKASGEAVGIPEPTRSADDLGKEFGISGSTIERVRSIMEHGTPEQIRSSQVFAQYTNRFEARG
jgi:hypothetical protein